MIEKDDDTYSISLDFHDILDSISDNVYFALQNNRHYVKVSDDDRFNAIAIRLAELLKTFGIEIVIDAIKVDFITNLIWCKNEDDKDWITILAGMYSTYIHYAHLISSGITNERFVVISWNDILANVTKKVYLDGSL